MASLECAASAEVHEASPPTVKPETSDPLRIVLVGKTGTGRSSSGNTILGRDAFRVEVSPCSVTTQCETQTGTVAGRSVCVTDTPGFFNTRLSPQEVLAEVGRCVARCSVGPHVFLLTLQPGRFTQEERDTLEWIKAAFGPTAPRFTMILFTWGDQLRGKRIKDFLEESNELSEFVSSCQGGCHILDNSGSRQDGVKEDSQQVVQLLEKIDKLVEENGGGCYSDEMFKEAERAIRQAQERVLGVRPDRAVSLERKAEENEAQGPETEGSSRKEEEEDRRREEEDARKCAEKLFWCELVTALGKGAAEGAGIMGKDKGKGKAVKKTKVVEKAVALAAKPLSVTSAAKVVGGAMREGSKVLYKHRKTLLH